MVSTVLIVGLAVPRSMRETVDAERLHAAANSDCPHPRASRARLISRRHRAGNAGLIYAIHPQAPGRVTRLRPRSSGIGHSTHSQCAKVGARRTSWPSKQEKGSEAKAVFCLPSEPLSSTGAKHPALAGLHPAPDVDLTTTLGHENGARLEGLPAFDAVE